jgi:hypothetical protein
MMKAICSYHLGDFARLNDIQKKMLNQTHKRKVTTTIGFEKIVGSDNKNTTYAS